MNRTNRRIGLCACVCLGAALIPACNNPKAVRGMAAPVQESVRAMADSIAGDLSARGPAAWLHYFNRSPQFFMASDGKLVFPNNDSADAFVQRFATQVKKIRLTWTGVRVDSLRPDLALMAAEFQEVFTNADGSPLSVSGYFSGLAEATPSGWRLRDAHWSIAGR